MPLDFFKNWQYLPDDFRQTLISIKNQPDEGAVFDKVMVGPCPNCGSIKTRNCEHTAISDSTVCLCRNCGCLGCYVCGAVFNAGETECPHWRICANCSEPKNARGFCPTPIWNCPIIRKWKQSRQYVFEF